MNNTIISYSDSLPGNMSVGHRVTYPVSVRRQSRGRELCREEREGSQLMSHIPATGIFCVPQLKLFCRPSWHLASLCGQREAASLSDTGHVSWVWAHLADCQRAQVFREGKEGKTGRGRRSGISLGQRRQCVINTPHCIGRQVSCLHQSSDSV